MNSTLSATSLKSKSGATPLTEKTAPAGLQLFDWTWVRSYLVALEQSTVQGAAVVLGLSQPTVSRHIAELEHALGVILFERTGRGLSPTAAGLRLMQKASVMRDAAHDLQRLARGEQTALGGNVRISASQTVAALLLPPILAQMRLALPDVNVQLVVSNEVSNLLRRDADLALRMVTPDQTGLVAKRIGKITLSAYAHEKFVRQYGLPRSVEELTSFPLIGGDRNDTILKGLHASGLSWQADQFVLRTDDLVTYWKAVQAGIGIGFVADFVASSDAQIVPVLPQLKIPPFPLWIAVHREVQTNPRIRAVYDFLSQAVPQRL